MQKITLTCFHPAFADPLRIKGLWFVRGDVTSHLSDYTTTCADYEMPDGFEIALDQCGDEQWYGPDGQHGEIVANRNKWPTRPALLHGSEKIILRRISEYR